MVEVAQDGGVRDEVEEIDTPGGIQDRVQRVVISVSESLSKAGTSF